MCRPLLIAAISCLLLGALAAFAPQSRLTYDQLSSFPETTGSREGFAIIEKPFSPGDLAPMNVIVETEDEASAAAVVQGLAAHPGVERVSGPQAGQSNPNLRAYDVRLAAQPYSMEALRLVPEIRETAEQALRQSGGDGDEGRVWIAGMTAELYDAKRVNERDIRVVFPIIIALIGTLLVIYLRSLTAALYLIATVVLSYLSALGLGWLVLHHILGMEAKQAPIPPRRGEGRRRRDGIRHHVRGADSCGDVRRAHRHADPDAHADRRHRGAGGSAGYVPRAAVPRAGDYGPPGQTGLLARAAARFTSGG